MKVENVKRHEKTASDDKKKILFVYPFYVCKRIKGKNLKFPRRRRPREAVNRKNNENKLYFSLSTTQESSRSEIENKKQKLFPAKGEKDVD